jgi:hypothetical protein
LFKSILVNFHILFSFIKFFEHGKATIAKIIIIDPIFIGINRSVAKGLSVLQNINNNTTITAQPPYPCPIVNRFVEDLFELSRMVRAVEHAIRIAQV